MTSRDKYTIPAPLAIGMIATGVALAGTDTWSNFEFMLQAEGGRITSLVAAIPAVSVAAMLALPGARLAWRSGHRFEAIILVAVLIAASAFSLSATLDRTGQGRAAQLAERRTANTAGELARDRLAQAKADLAKAEDEAARERADGGCGPKCKAWEAKADAARERIRQAEADVIAAGAPRTVDTLAASVMLIFPTLPEATVANATALVQPMLLPLVMYLGGLGFIGVGAGALMQRRPKRKAAAKRPAKKPARREPRVPRTKRVAPTRRVANDNVVSFPGA